MRTAELLDVVRERCAIQSDYRLAKMLGVKGQSVSMWRHGHSYPGKLSFFQLCTMAGMPGPEISRWLCLVWLERTERSGNERDAATWRSIAQERGYIEARAA